MFFSLFFVLKFNLLNATHNSETLNTKRIWSFIMNSCIFLEEKKKIGFRYQNE